MIKKNLYSIIITLIITYLSLTSSDTFRKVHVINIPHIDKIVHFFMYFGLMTAIIYEHRGSLKNNRSLVLVSLIPLSYGVLMEILQSALTVTRTASIYDVFANASGIMISFLLWIWIRPRIKENLR